MQTMPLLGPAEYVWIPGLDAGAAEPAPVTAPLLRAVHLERREDVAPTTRKVTLETLDGDLPLPRRIHQHGDVGEGWDWGWRGSAPLETALNLLAALVHPKAAWRLQWAFCDTFLLPMRTAGGTLDGDHLRAWLREHDWIGRASGGWEAAARAEYQAPLARERRRSRWMSPAARAAHALDLVTSAMRWDAEDRRAAAAEVAAPSTRLWGAAALPGPAEPPGSAAYQLERAAAALAGAPADACWPTLAALAARIAPRGSPGWTAWRDAAHQQPALPRPETLELIARMGSPEGDRSPWTAAALLARCIRRHASDAGPPAGDTVPELALFLGAALEGAPQGEPRVTGDPAALRATLHALDQALVQGPELADRAARMGVTSKLVRARARAALAPQVAALREHRGALREEAEMEAEYARQATTLRLPRGRSEQPADASRELWEWAAGATVHTLVGVARAGPPPRGMIGMDGLLRLTGHWLPDPHATVVAAARWQLEERAPMLVGLAPFPVRGDGLLRTPEWSPPQVWSEGPPAEQSSPARRAVAVETEQAWLAAKTEQAP
ncbi:DUF6166 domain-containing protein [Longimicrobium terrae]|uniref:Uncharacterized protein n=1 Tax=Longimicrobium terrae TaxID=1639882 RepID=A0A841GXG1_9BACT|nr:DUF6166 domain-containing protein [Longimicrobium terrae]MBB4635900.1 hypothetical protein [Longimicrobium terrae]MBB6070296.1 hypothetical protein [Longimicrobium terrae]NNC30798.1 hypothetical protein [Longimicrobium terrae]